MKLLTATSRGISSRVRHLYEDLLHFLPHAKKEKKLRREDEEMLLQIVESRNCDFLMFWECRKAHDTFLHLSSLPKGPSIKFQVVDIHTMGELRFKGNAIKGTRPILSFDSGFKASNQFAIIEEMLKRAFQIPFKHPKAHPYIDRIMQFNVSPEDGSIFVRNYQIETVDKGRKSETLLHEIGPRFTLLPIEIIDGPPFTRRATHHKSAEAPVLWKNASYVPPSVIEKEIVAKAAFTHQMRHEQSVKAGLKPRGDELDKIDSVWREARSRKMELQKEEDEIKDEEEELEEEEVGEESGEEEEDSGEEEDEESSSQE
ncbi:Ribosome biogenesis protein BRX1 like protein [Aduncisulcus paluster]|uniref:Ribosome biogenesis protein BRX1 like protein n=1 Tax=Aduncisulcus paluster TaxID=2918883 RepID=A0ABQ5KK60_9EUKA|nr:Ribosome biogenesis protein BRX1 like protein [Aduncisulcus paluster]